MSPRYQELLVRELRDLLPLAVGVSIWAWKKWRVRGNAHWPTAQATVCSYRFDAERPIVVYTFTVNGQYYSGEFEVPKSFSRWFRKDSPVEESFPLGLMFPIRYNPEDPSLSVPVRAHDFATSYSAA